VASVWLSFNQAQLEASRQALAAQTQALGPGQVSSVWLSFNQAQLEAAQQALAAQTQALGPGGFAFVTANVSQLEAARQGLEAQTQALGPGGFVFVTANTSRLDAIGTQLESMSLKASEQRLGLQTTLGAIAPLEASGLGSTATLGAMRSALGNQAQP
jgi:hypothetical protein